MDWRRSDMGDGVDAFGPSNRLMEAFTAYGLSVKGAVPHGFGVFSYYNRETNNVEWYFSPEAVALADQFGARPSEKPVPVDGFGLLVGEARSWKVHFPGYARRR